MPKKTLTVERCTEGWVRVVEWRDEEEIVKGKWVGMTLLPTIPFPLPPFPTHTSPTLLPLGLGSSTHPLGARDQCFPESGVQWRTST